MIVSEMRLFQSIRAGKYGEETFFNQLRQPGIVIRRLDGYFSVEFEGETFCTEAVNVRQWSPVKETHFEVGETVTIPTGTLASKPVGTMTITGIDRDAGTITVGRHTRGPNKPKVTEPNGEA